VVAVAYPLNVWYIEKLTVKSVKCKLGDWRYGNKGIEVGYS